MEPTNPNPPEPTIAQLSSFDALRKMEMLGGRLPSQTIRQIHAAGLDQRMAQLWENIEREKLKPNCPPETLSITKNQLAMSLAGDPNFLIAAVLRFLDNAYVYQLDNSLSESEKASVMKAAISPAESPSPASAEAAKS